MDINKENTKVEPGKIIRFDPCPSPEGLDEILVENINSFLTVRELDKGIEGCDPFRSTSQKFQFDSSFMIDPDEGGESSRVDDSLFMRPVSRKRKEATILDSERFLEGKEERSASHSDSENFYQEIPGFFKQKY